MAQASVYDTQGLLHNESERLEGSGLLDDVKKTIRKFVSDMHLREGIGEHRQLFYLTKLRKIAEWMDDSFLKPELKDIEKLVRGIDKRYESGNTRDDYKVTIKRFYRWLLGDDKTVPEIVRWIKLNGNPEEKKKPEPIVTEEEYSKLINACLNPRDKALIALLYDSGCRISELLTLRIEDVIFDQYGMVLSVTGKTGSRRVRVIGDSVAYVNEWIRTHPSKSAGKENNKPFLFTGIIERERNNVMNYAMVSARLKEIARRAGIKRRIHPHLFRHTRATLLARDVPEAPLELQMGWTFGSNQARTYVHLSGRQQDEAILKAYGIDIQKEKKKTELPITCSRCQTICPAGSKFCLQCSNALNNEALQDLRDLQTMSESYYYPMLYVDDVKLLRQNMTKLIDAGILKFDVDPSWFNDETVRESLKILRRIGKEGFAEGLHPKWKKK